LVIPLIFAFAVSGGILFGPFSQDYAEISSAFLSSLMLAMGRFDRNIIINAEFWPTFIYLTIYYLFVIFFLITSLVGIYVDNYRITMMDYGYNFALFV